MGWGGLHKRRRFYLKLFLKLAVRGGRVAQLLKLLSRKKLPVNIRVDEEQKKVFPHLKLMILCNFWLFCGLHFLMDSLHRWATQCKTLASLTTSPLTNFTPPLTLIRYFQL